MSKRPTTVVFDMDDVLCRYDFHKRLACLFEMTGVAPETINEVIWEQGLKIPTAGATPQRGITGSSARNLG